MSYAPRIVAHRGLHDAHPENSVAAFLAAWDAAVEWCECDVRMTSDLTVVVIHDETLERTTTRCGRVDQLPWTEVSQAKLRRADGSVSDQTVPFYIAEMRKLTGPKRRTLVEIKHDVRQQLWWTMAGCADEDVELQSFDLSTVIKTIDRNRDARVHLLVENPSVLARAHDGPWVGVNVAHGLLDGRVVERLQSAGKQVGVWTVNDDADIRRVLALGVDTIISDRPLRVGDILAEIE